MTDCMKLLELIGQYGVQCSETKELAPPRELIDEIARIDALFKGGGWIGVEEELPVGIDEVIYLSNYGHIGTTGAARIRNLYEDARRNSEICFYKAWQPLPPLTQEEGRSDG